MIPVGFFGYAADAELPTLLQILAGEKPANSAAIRVAMEPGKLLYSAAGFTVVHILGDGSDLTHQPTLDL